MLKTRMPFVVVTSLLLIVGSGEAVAQRRLGKIQQRLDDLRPKGKILKQLRDGLNRDSASKEDAFKQRNQGTPSRAEVPPNHPRPQRTTPQVAPDSNAIPPTGVSLGIEIEETKGGGVLVVGVDEGSAAEIAGLEVNDRILGVGRTKIVDGNDLTRVLKSLSVGDEIPFQTIHRGKLTQSLVSFTPENQGDLANELRQSSLPNADLPPTTVSRTADRSGLRSVLYRRDEITASPGNLPSTRNSDRQPQLAPNPVRKPTPSRQNGATRSEVEMLRSTVRQQQKIINELRHKLEQNQNASSNDDAPTSADEDLNLSPPG